MGWGLNQPTGYWLLYQNGMKGPPIKIQANSEQEARQKYKDKYGQYPDSCEMETE